MNLIEQIVVLADGSLTRLARELDYRGGPGARVLAREIDRLASAVDEERMEAVELALDEHGSGYEARIELAEQIVNFAIASLAGEEGGEAKHAELLEVLRGFGTNEDALEKRREAARVRLWAAHDAELAERTRRQKKPKKTRTRRSP